MKPDILLEDNFIENSAALFDALAADVAWEEHIRARKTASFGRPYNYSNITYPNAPMHPTLIVLCDRLEAKLGFRPNNCLLNYYESGESTMGFHSDSVDELLPDTGVAIVSLGAERTITFRNIVDIDRRCEYRLKSGSLLYMGQDVQHQWKHAILKQLETGGRISLTFRSLR